MVYVEERGDTEDDRNHDYGCNDLGNDSMTLTMIVTFGEERCQGLTRGNESCILKS